MPHGMLTPMHHLLTVNLHTCPKQISGLLHLDACGLQEPVANLWPSLSSVGSMTMVEAA